MRTQQVLESDPGEELRADAVGYGVHNCGAVAGTRPFRVRAGPAVDNLEEKLQHVAAGRAISFLPASLAATFIQPGIAYVRVTDIPPIQICLAWKADQPSPLVAAFAACADDAH